MTLLWVLASIGAGTGVAAVFIVLMLTKDFVAHLEAHRYLPRHEHSEAGE